MVRNATAPFLPPKFHNIATKKNACSCFALATASVSLETLKEKKKKNLHVIYT